MESSNPARKPLKSPLRRAGADAEIHADLTPSLPLDEPPVKQLLQVGGCVGLGRLDDPDKRVWRGRDGVIVREGSRELLGSTTATHPAMKLRDLTARDGMDPSAPPLRRLGLTLARTAEGADR